MKLTNLGVCNLDAPIGYAMEAPVFSWTVEDAAGEQAWAKITVRANGETVFESAEEKAADSFGWKIELPLNPRTRYDYTLTVQSTDGKEAEADSFFETGKRDEAWKARWISPGQSRSSALLRKRFTLTEPVKAARLYICGLGVYEAWLNEIGRAHV